MNKLLTILMAAVLCMAIAACGGGGGDDSTPVASAPQAPTNTPAPTPTPTPKITAMPTPVPVYGQSQVHPVPVGQPAVYADGWTITVLSTVPDATAQVLAFNPDNVPPAEDKQFFMATIQATYNGTEPVAAFGAGFVLRAIGGNYSPYSISSSCGIIPGEFPSTEVTPGGSLTGNVCWSVREFDAETLVMFYTPTAGNSVAVQYSDLTP